jgi:hypothetical protein
MTILGLKTATFGSLIQTFQYDSLARPQRPFCHTLRHDGIDYGDYIEQLTYLLFLKMIEEKGV